MLCFREICVFFVMRWIFSLKGWNFSVKDKCFVWFVFLNKFWEKFSINKFLKIIKSNKFFQFFFSKLVWFINFPNKSLSHTYQINHFYQNSLSKKIFKTSFEKKPNQTNFRTFYVKTCFSNTKQGQNFWIFPCRKIYLKMLRNPNYENSSYPLFYKILYEGS